MMGGELRVDSLPGLGSKFTFELTFDTIDAPADIPAREIGVARIEKPTLKGEILLCEDNYLNQQVICAHLERVGLKTIVAENGQQGVEMVKKRLMNGEKPFDLIFMDMHMPVMDGLEAASIISQLNTGTPVVAMTANVMTSDMEIYKAHGMEDCVGKPFTSQDLWRCLLKYFKEDEQKESKNEEDEDENLFQQLRIEFVKENRTICTDIATAVAFGDVKLAHRLAHTLKSNAGMLGKTRLQEVAAEVERQISEGVEVQLYLLETELKVVLEEFTPSPSIPSVTSP
jgi:CheY-like chemotaxis protein